MNQSFVSWVAILIEQLEWYKNLERGRMLLQEKDEQGAEPDPKDFD